MNVEYSTFSHKIRMDADIGLLPIGEQVSLLTDLIRLVLTDNRVTEETRQYIKEYMAEALDKF